MYPIPQLQTTVWSITWIQYLKSLFILYNEVKERTFLAEKEPIESIIKIMKLNTIIKKMKINDKKKWKISLIVLFLTIIYASIVSFFNKFQKKFTSKII